MNSYHLAIISLVISALSFSWFLVPSNEEAALMNLRDKNYTRAYELYTQACKGERPTVANTIPLTKLHLQFGNVDAAIDLMEGYIQAHPDSFEAQKMLMVYYQYAQRTDRYLALLEKITEVEPTVDRLRELSDMYSFNGQKDKQLKVLTQLIAIPESDPEDFIKLAYLLAADKRYTEAAQTLLQVGNRKPEAVTDEVVSLGIHLIAEAEHCDGGLSWEKHLRDLLDTFLGNRPPAKDALAVAKTLHERDYDKLCLHLLDTYSNKMLPQHRDQYFTVLVKAQKASGKYTEAYRLVLSLQQVDQLPNTLLPDAIDLAIDHKDDHLLSDLADSADLSLVSDGLLTTLLEYSLEHSKPALLNAALVGFGVSPSRSFKEIKSSTKQKECMMTVFLRTEHPILAQRVAESLRKDENEKLSVRGLIALAQVHLYKKDPAKALRNLTMAQNQGDRDKIFALALVAQELAEKKEFSTTPELHNERFYQLLYRHATAFSAPKSALQASRWLFEHDPSPQHRQYLGYSLFWNENFEEAVEYLRQVVDEEKELYLSALIEATKRNPSYRQELTQALVAKMNNQDLSDKELRDISFILFEDCQESEPALKILFKLAQEADYTSADVAQFLYVCEQSGVSPSVSWLEKRAQKSEGKELTFWLRAFDDFDDKDRVLTLARECVSELDEEGTRLYLDLLIEANCEEGLAELIAFKTDSSASQELLRDLSLLAYEREHLNDAFRLFARYFAGETIGEDALLHTYYGSLLEKKGDISGAQAHFLAALEVFSKEERSDRDLQTMKVHLLLKTNQPHKAQQILAEILTEQPDDEETRMQLAALLIEEDNRQQALEHYRYLFAAGNTTIEEAYLQTLLEEARAGAQLAEELEMLLMRKLERSDLDDNTQRDIAFALLEYCNKKDTVKEIFFRLAQKKDSDHSDVLQLLYLVGPRPNAQIVSWLERRAASSRGEDEEQINWLTYLQRVGAHSAVVKIMEASRCPLKGKWYELRINSLIATGQTDKIDRAIRQKLVHVSDSEAILSLTELAMTHRLPRTARATLQHLLKQPVHKEVSLRYAGLLAYEREWFQEATSLLARYFKKANFDASDFDALYAYGDMLTHRKKDEEARVFYRKALTSISADPPLTRLQIMRKAQIFVRIGELENSIAVLREQQQKYPRDYAVKADLAHLLMDTGEYKEAETLLFAREEAE